MQSTLNLSGKSRLPLIRQNEAAECGLASLAMVAGYYGFKTDLATLRRRYAAGLQGMTLRHIIEVATKMEFATRPIKVPLEMIDQVKLPAVLHWDMNHFVVLKSVGKNKMVVHDPALGERTYTTEEFSDHFTGVALELTPSETFEKREEKTTLRLTDLWGRMFGLKRNLVQVFILSVVLQLFVLASPFYLQIAVDEVLTKFDTDLLFVIALGFAGFTLINVLTQTLRGYVLLYFGSMMSYQMVGNLFRHLLKLPIDFFEKRHIGDIVSRFGSMEPIKVMLTEGLIASLIDGMMALTTLVLMFIYSPILAAIALTAWALYLVLRMMFYRPFRQAQEDAIIARAKEQTTFMETVRGMTSLKLFGGESERTGMWQNRYAEVINTNAKSSKLGIWFQSANSGIFGIEHIILIYVAVQMVLSADFSVGMIFAFMAYKRNFTDKATALVEKAIEYRMLSLHLERIADIAHAEQEEQPLDIPQTIEQPPLTGEIILQNIRYRYADNTPDVLKNVDLHIKAGESVAIAGPSGCGKTTLLKIMTGLFKPNEGQVLLGDTSLSDYGLTKYRKHIGVVMQEDDLFAGSISENIAFFDPETDMERVIAAAKAAQIHNEIMAMPMNYESLVGDMGSALSGGQKQRIMLARALYRQPKILFMDEGTAHLDVETERMVNQSIANLGITRIIIAHRPETIKSAERVMEMRDGQLCEIGLPPKFRENNTNETEKNHKTEGIHAPAF
ncbi:peptidase domain-containing ABC transporter [Kordiimonas sp. SCSIO 12603]|uniref:peptidase domain-containing ABC transporter n=1 Tax=Kordiimonas sp. SCSIO 12603 TaxID=2829596 RepID=UPI0021085A43|nr:peptidase domain-containing ABC transporter [Kordiimonas sp. SCSIO 12603]UTW58823.1 peptidase domain-containing ABC transporter [Kordiimonas sp. SCSIO 12603]